ncbi:MAG: carboxypeptidase regulatory-like domain-containing protein [Planctomycetes bacterium]|nr:carboxypeptidase regulatory-like domain-containing protein [Planctomycetota bacterium]
MTRGARARLAVSRGVALTLAVLLGVWLGRAGSAPYRHGEPSRSGAAEVPATATSDSTRPPGAPTAAPAAPGLCARVVDDSRRPLAGCLVLAEALRPAGWLTRTPAAERPAAATRTPVDGRFALDRPPATAFALVLDHPQFPPRLLLLDADTERGAELGDLELRSSVGLGVTVYAAGDRRGVANARVRTQPALLDPRLGPLARARLERIAITDRDGRAELHGVPPTALRITVAAAGFATAEVTVPPAVAADRPRRTRVELAVGHALQGEVVTPAGLPVAGAVLAASPAVAGGCAQAGTTDALGRFRIEGLAAGPHALCVTTPGRASVELRIDVPARTPLRIEQPAGATLEGRLLDAVTGRPVAAARVRAVGEPGSPAPPLRDARSDAQGAFRLDGLPPGRTRLLVTSERCAPLWTGPLDCGSGPPAGPQLELRLEPGPVAQGVVTDESGTPLASAVIEMVDGNLDGTSFADLLAQAARGPLDPPAAATRCQPDGTFALPLPVAPDARVRLCVSAPDRATLLTAPVTASAGLARIGALRLPPARTLRGEVCDASGAPVAGADVVAEPLIPAGVEPGGPTPVFGRAIAGRDGRFAIGGLGPFGYTVRAVAPPLAAPAGQELRPAVVRVELRTDSLAPLRLVLR